MHHPVIPQIKKFFFIEKVWKEESEFIQKIDLLLIFLYYKKWIFLLNRKEDEYDRIKKITGKTGI